MILYDARGNEYRGSVDSLNGETLTETRTTFQNLSAINAETVVQLNGHSTCAFDIRGTFSGTVVIEGSVDGTNYVSIPALNTVTEVYITNITTSPVIAKVEVSGYRYVRARMSSYTSGTVIVSARASMADEIIYAKPIPATLVVTATAAANTGVTATLPSPATGMYHYITGIEITRNATAALAGTATLVITTTNIPRSLAWSVGNAMAAGGTQIDVSRDFSVPLKSTAPNTATTIVCPVPGAAVLWRVNVFYYVGS